MKRTPSSLRNQIGFSLVEVLITLVIMSVGMLGIMGLYVQSMQAGRTSTFRHHAVTITGDIADRIRANPTAGAAYAALLGADNGCVPVGATPAVDCTPAQMAANDIILWQAQATDTLPSGTVAVVFTASVAGAAPTYQITVAWVEPGQTPSFGVTIPVLPR